LRDYLDYAKRGILTTTDETGRPPDSDFEIAVMAALTANGYEVRPQLGVAGYFLDLAVRNPDRPGEWLAAVECDGATYHSGLSVRDRDRIRQEILESLGWKGRIYRIWSTDWFYNPLPEIAKLTAFLSECRADSRRREQEEPVLFPWEEESDDDVSASVIEPVPEPVADADKQAVEALREDEAEAPPSDLFVEVGDRVTYCFLDNPAAKMTVMIVDSASNPKLNIVNENTPLAQALLGLSPGEDGSFVPPGQKDRNIRIVKVER
jgi:very-short-patch-repair endonuclease